MDYISMLNGTDERYHRSPIIIHVGNSYFAEFETIDQLEFFAKTLGFGYEMVEERPWLDTNMIYRKYSMTHEINRDNPYFWKLTDIPENAKPIKALSNGKIVTCYFVNDGKAINFYRPNPNAKDVHKPLSIDDHIVHRRIYGLY